MWQCAFAFAFAFASPSVTRSYHTQDECTRRTPGYISRAETTAGAAAPSPQYRKTWIGSGVRDG